MKYYFTLLIVTASFVTGSLAPAADLDWSQWRGPQRANISPDKGLLKEWPEGGPELVWTFENAGVGFSSFAIVDGKLYTMGAFDDAEYLLCLDAAKGAELWKTEVGPLLKDGRGDGPRGTPTVDGEYVYGLSGTGNAFCISLDSKDVKWSLDVKTLGGKVPTWGYSESVLVDDKKVVCKTGGNKGTVLALDKSNGEVLWHQRLTETSTNRRSREQSEGPARAHYSSIVPAIINSQSQYVVLTQNLLAGLRSSDGEVLWSSPWPRGRTAVVPTPVIRDNYVYITSGYGTGCKLVKVNPDNSVEDVYVHTEEEPRMVNHHGGVVLVGETIYGHSDRGGWLAQDFMTGEYLWEERIRDPGKGSVTYADGMLYCVEENSGGEIILAEANRDEFRERGRFSLPRQSESGLKIWTHPVVINGKLFLRDQELIFCYDVSAK
jgi:outer membrane protein assembly factor BamB